MSTQQTCAPRALTILVLCAAGTFASCGGDEAAAGERPPTAKAEVAKKEAPKVDVEARYNGKTLSEYTPGLKDLNPAQRKQAMTDILKFGADAFPLKEQMRTMAVEDSADELRTGALFALYEMKDPDANEFLLERLSDPSAMQTPRGWRTLLQIISKNIDAAALPQVASSLANSNTKHAESLLRLSSGTFRNALAQSLMTNEHSDATLSIIMQVLPGLGLSSAEQVAYIVTNYKRLPNSNQALNSLRGIGDEAAFAAAMTILAETAPPLQTRLGIISGFPAANIPGGKKIDAIAAYLPGASEPDVQQIFGAMQSVARKSGDEAAPKRFQAILTESAATTNPDAKIRSLAILYLCEGVAGGQMTAEGLDPVFAALDTDQEEIILGTAMQEMQKLVRRAPAAILTSLPERMATTMYVRDTSDKWAHAVAKGMFDAINAGRGKLSLGSLIKVIGAQVDSHQGHPVNFQVLQWLAPQSRQLKAAGVNMQEAAGLAGRLLVDASFGPAQGEWLNTRANLSGFDNTSVAEIETIIAYYEPILMAAKLPEDGYFAYTYQNATTTLSHLRGKPDAEKFLAFALRMAQEASPAVRVKLLWGINMSHYLSYNPAESKGMARFGHSLAGKQAWIKPTVLGRYRSNQIVAPAKHVTGDAGEVFLMTRVPNSNPPDLGSLAGLSTAFAIAFLDESGKVIANGRSDDASLRIEQGNLVTLTHPQAKHALLYKAGEFELPVGAETGFDPKFLAAM